MSAQPIARVDAPGAGRAAVELRPMRLDDVQAVAAVERTIYTAPWTEGNFVDSLTAGYSAWVLREPKGLDALVGYFVLMPAVDEAHLLNVSVAATRQRRGHGLVLLRKAIELAAEHNARSVILEVRPSNERAIDVYRRFGFREHGIRRRYYPASSVDQTTREDAIVMRMTL